jgi:hypothetical protein
MSPVDWSPDSLRRPVDSLTQGAFAIFEKNCVLTAISESLTLMPAVPIIDSNRH